MAESMLGVGFMFYIGLIITNGFVAKTKRGEALFYVILSLFFAPLVYLYLLAVPEKKRFEDSN